MRLWEERCDEGGLRLGVCDKHRDKNTKAQPSFLTVAFFSPVIGQEAKEGREIWHLKRNTRDS